MGTWSSEILGNDTSCEVQERFFELYDLGEIPENITSIVLEEQSDNLQYDRTNVWLGIALACWECKVLTKDIFTEIEKIVDTKEDIKFNEKLEASLDFLTNRQKVLDKFIAKIALPKPKPRAKKASSIQVQSMYTAGMCLTYKNLDNNYIGIYITESEHFKSKGKIVFFFLDFETKALPTTQMFEKSKLYGLTKLGKEWGNYEYQGNVTDLNYTKDTKDDFIANLPQTLTLICTLKAPNLHKLINNFRGDFMHLSNPEKMIIALENLRIKGKNEHVLSSITLHNLLGKVGL